MSDSRAEKQKKTSKILNGFENKPPKRLFAGARVRRGGGVQADGDRAEGASAEAKGGAGEEDDGRNV